MYTVNTKINNQLSLWLITMFIMISIMIVVGGLTRLTDSGLSITKWELFKGILPPLTKETWILYFNFFSHFWSGIIKLMWVQIMKMDLTE